MSLKFEAFPCQILNDGSDNNDKEEIYEVARRYQQKKASAREPRRKEILRTARGLYAMQEFRNCIMFTSSKYCDDKKFVPPLEVAAYTVGRQ